MKKLGIAILSLIASAASAQTTGDFLFQKKKSTTGFEAQYLTPTPGDSGLFGVGPDGNAKLYDYPIASGGVDFGPDIAFLRYDGDDGTAVLGDPQKPFGTLDGAIAALSLGGQVVSLDPYLIITGTPLSIATGMAYTITYPAGSQIYGNVTVSAGTQLYMSGGMLFGDLTITGGTVTAEGTTISNVWMTAGGTFNAGSSVIQNQITSDDSYLYMRGCVVGVGTSIAGTSIASIYGTTSEAISIFDATANVYLDRVTAQGLNNSASGDIEITAYNTVTEYDTIGLGITVVGYGNCFACSGVGPEGPEGPQGPQGDPGATGATGAAGADGEGVPTGGTTGQVLAKVSGTDYDTEWVDQSGGAADFTDLGDVPSSYTGQGGKHVRVNAGATGLEFVDAPTTPILAAVLAAGNTTGSNNIVVDPTQGVAFSSASGGGGTAITGPATTGGSVYTATLQPADGTVAYTGDITLQQAITGGGTVTSGTASFNSGSTLSMGSGSTFQARVPLRFAGGGGNYIDLTTATATGTHTATLQNKTYTIAGLDDIPATPALSTVLAAGNSTGSNTLTITNGRHIAFPGTGAGEVRLSTDLTGGTSYTPLLPHNNGRILTDASTAAYPGSAATLTTARTIQTNLASTSSASFNGSANITPGVTGTLPVTNGGTGRNTSTTAYGLIAAGTTATGAHQTLATGTAGQVLVSGGSAALPTWQTPVARTVGVMPMAANFYAWSNMPSAETFFNSQGRWVYPVDLTNATMIRVVATMPNPGALPANGAKIRIKYKTEASGFSTTIGDYSSLAASGQVEVTMSNAMGVYSSSWTAIAAGAKTTVILAVSGVDGDGAADPQFGSISIDYY